MQAIDKLMRIEETVLGVADPALGDVAPVVHLRVYHRGSAALLPQLAALHAEFAGWTYSASRGLAADHACDKDRPLDEVLARLTCELGGRVLALCRQLRQPPPHQLRVSKGPVTFLLPLPAE